MEIDLHFPNFFFVKCIQSDSGGICNTLGNDSMCDSKQKSSYEHFCLQSHILSFPKVLQIPPESPCIFKQGIKKKQYHYNPGQVLRVTVG